jgi:ribonuclease G
VIEGMLNRRVDLPSGGYLMIDYAEALTVIDVNTGSFTGKGKAARLEDTITKTNLEAAEEVVNQLRLRDIGGIIVIDFIDMARARNRDTVLKTLRKSLDEDRTKTFVVEISPLGLVEMTRQNVTDGVREIMTKPCPVCGGEGVVKSEETMAIHVARHLREMVREAGGDGPEAYLVRLNSRVTAWFTADGARELQALEEDTGRYFHFTGSEGLPLDHFSVVLEGTRDEVAEQAVPFRGGEEVHVDIVEPHMYNPDDAVAKVDGYVITVTNGVAFVGEKKLVRIEEARRTTATATLTGSDAEAADRAAADRVKEREKVEQRAKRSAAAKRGAAKRKEREAATKQPPVAELADAEAEAVEALTDQTEAGAGTGPAAAEDAGDDAPKARRRRGGRSRSRARGSENGDTAKAAEVAEVAEVAEAAEAEPEEPGESSSNGDAVESKPRRRGRRGGRRRSRAKAPAEATEASQADE